MNVSNWKTMAASVVVASALAIPGFAMADHHGHHGDKGPHHERMLERMAEKLELTEEQKAQIKANHEANRAEHRKLREEMHKVREEVSEALDSGADQATLDELASRLGALQIEKMRQRREMHEQLKAVLTDEQKAKLEQMHSERKDRWKERRQKRPDSQ
ncbi:Spy/CpxP family protein refolding chaperone [Microbulbifer yueqingensis]|uniref:Protein refolding chaperone Spy/CpxP family n=1 Tax=Microbulbifer yueqingensis TaxID=658219 RepID=A0A1G8UX00_9GAMM|nr:Spy/CpxP family protein refolding chaperone [Microbulbifer yueqingensis]SDJ58249.1 protein refolding chaperone Spy/CpxP family [Microbulbifer yueqingensis]